MISGYINLEKKRMLINRSDSFYRKNFTVAHELEHRIMHKNEIGEDEDVSILDRKPFGKECDALEVQANSFAAHLLLPDSMLKDKIEESDLELSNIFKASQSVIGFRKINLQKNYQGI